MGGRPDCGGGRVPAARTAAAAVYRPAGLRRRPYTGGADGGPTPRPAARSAVADIWIAVDGSYVNCLDVHGRSLTGGAIGSAATAREISRAISIRAGYEIVENFDGGPAAAPRRGGRFCRLGDGAAAP